MSTRSTSTSSESSNTVSSSSSSTSRSSTSVTTGTSSSSSSSGSDIGVHATFNWTDAADIGAGNVRIYHNGGVAARLYPDYSAVVDTVAAGVQTWTSGPLADGVWVFGFRTYNGTVEELNTCVLAIIRVEDGVEVSAYPAKPELKVETYPGGTMLLRSLSDPMSSFRATTAQFFTNDGAGGAVDYDTPITGGPVDIDRSGNVHFGILTTPAYGETARKFGCIVYAADGTPSMHADEVTATPDATPPDPPLDVAIDEGRD